MKILFIHQNYPGQFRESLPRLAATGKHQIVFLTQRRVEQAPAGYAVAVYKQPHKTPDGIHRYASLFDGQVAAGQSVRRACEDLKNVASRLTSWSGTWAGVRPCSSTTSIRKRRSRRTSSTISFRKAERSALTLNIPKCPT